jgi:branched-chain amino acid transport system permease protein
MDFIVIQLLSSITFGMLLFLVAAGMTLIFGLMDIVNMSHGSYFLLSGYVGFAVTKYTGSFLLGVLVGSLLLFIVGILAYRGLLQQPFARTPLSQVLLTYGMLLIIDNFCLWIWGGVPQTADKPEALEGPVHLGPIVFPLYWFALIIAGIAVAVLLWWFEERTKYGAMVRAGVDDEKMTEAIGINIIRVKQLVYGLGALLAGFGGVISAPFLGVYIGLDTELLVLGLVVIIVGGVGSLRGAFVGALLVSLVDTFGKIVFPEFAMFSIFALMAVVLVVRPSGLLPR